MIGFYLPLLFGGLGLASAMGGSKSGGAAQNGAEADRIILDDGRQMVADGLPAPDSAAPAAAESVSSWMGPSAEEQLLVELVNRARMDPEAEVARLNEPLAEGIAPDPVQPLAITAPLSRAARDHSEDMDDRDFFAHDNPEGAGPGARAIAAGNPSGYVGENIGWIGSSTPGAAQARVEAHHENLWASDGHQANLMHGRWSEIGTGYDQGDHQGFDHASFATELFGDQDDSYLTGVVIEDADGDNFYDLGEGLGGVRVTAYAGDEVYETASWGAGGYALALPPGTYRVVFEGGDLETPQESTVTIGDENVKLDVIGAGGQVLASVATTTPSAPDAGAELSSIPEPSDAPKADLITSLVTCGIPSDLAEQEAAARAEEEEAEELVLF